MRILHFVYAHYIKKKTHLKLLEHKIRYGKHDESHPTTMENSHPQWHQNQVGNNRVIFIEIRWISRAHPKAK